MHSTSLSPTLSHSSQFIRNRLFGKIQAQMTPMAKRTLDGHPMPGFIHQIAPEPTLQPNASISAPSTDDHRATPPQNASASIYNRKSFWTQPGIKAFVDWITNPENFNRLSKQRSNLGERIMDIHTSIAEYVNSKAGTTWTLDTVKQKVAYAKLQYRKAAQLKRNPGEAEDDLQARRFDVCPYFDRFHAVYASNLPLKAQPPQPRQLRRHLGKRMIVESSSDSSDLEDYLHHDHEDDGPGQMDRGMGERGASQIQASKDNGHVGHVIANKRQRQDKHHSLDSMGTILDDLKKQAHAMAATNESLQATWEEQHEAMLNHQRLEYEKALQQCVKEREDLLQQRVQEREKMLQQRAQELDEVYDRRRKELAVDKEEFRAERERASKKLEADKQELKNEQAELKRAMLEFTGERVRLVAENAKLAALLEVHAGQNRRQLHSS